MDDYRFALLTMLSWLSLTCAAQPADQDYTQAMAAYLVNDRQELVCLQDFAGKTLVVDYWYTGCGPCSHFFQERLRHVKAHFAGWEDIVFISVSADRDAAGWEKSVRSGLYTSPEMVNLHTGGRRFMHRAIKGFGIHRYPTLLVITKGESVIQVPGITTSTVAELCQLIAGYR